MSVVPDNSAVSLGAVMEDATHPAGTPLVQFDDVAFGYTADNPIISDVTIDVSRGNVVTLLGPSGCGKSTLMNMVAGLLFPDRGRVLFDGREITSVNTEVGYMTQHDTLLPWRTLSANIALPLRIRGELSKREIRDRVDEYLVLLKLEHATKLFPSQLSGGMRRRALFARSLITGPAMVLMDEPFAAMDADLREGLHIEVLRIVKDLNQTVLFVTHDISEAALLSDEVVVLAGAPVATVRRIVPIDLGTPRDLEALRISEEVHRLERLLRTELRHETSGTQIDVESSPGTKETQ